MKITGMNLRLSKGNRLWHLAVYSEDPCVKTFDSFDSALVFMASLRGQGDDPPMTEAEQIEEVRKGRT